MCSVWGKGVTERQAEDLSAQGFTLKAQPPTRGSTHTPDTHVFHHVSHLFVLPWNQKEERPVSMQRAPVCPKPTHISSCLLLSQLADGAGNSSPRKPASFWARQDP